MRCIGAATALALVACGAQSTAHPEAPSAASGELHVPDAAADTNPSQKEDEMNAIDVAALQERLVNEGPGAVIDELERSSDLVQASQAFNRLGGFAYFDRKDVALSLRLRQAGMRYAERSIAGDGVADDVREELRGIRKALAFNIASSTWPGWGDDVLVTPEQMAIGRQAAKLNLDLAVELRRGPDKVSIAHWAVGAHAMAAGDYAHAHEQYRLAVERAAEAGAQDHVALNQGYDALTSVLEGDAEGSARFAAAVQTLDDMNTDDATFFAQQLDTARTVFERRVEPPR